MDQPEKHSQNEDGELDESGRHVRPHFEFPQTDGDKGRKMREEDLPQEKAA